MKKYVATTCEIVVRAGFLSGIAACMFIFRASPATAFIATFFVAIAFVLYLKLDSIETSLSEEKRYNALWRRDNWILIAVAFIVVTALGMFVANRIAPRLAAPAPDDMINRQVEAIRAFEKVATESADVIKSSGDATLAELSRLNADLKKAVEEAKSEIKDGLPPVDMVKSTQKEIENLNSRVELFGGQVSALTEAVRELSVVVKALKTKLEQK